MLSRVVFTYGLDAVRDDAVANDSAYSRTTGFGPNPIISSSTRPSLPDADMRNVGLFLQGDWRLHERFSVITGVRYHDARRDAADGGSPTASPASRRTTAPRGVRGERHLPPHRSCERGGDVRARASARRTSSSATSGPSTDGTAIRWANPGLDAETSTNVDVGLRVSVARVEAEWFYFRNNLKDGILTRPTGRTIGRLAEFQNINVERLRTSGREATLRVDLGRGFDLNTNYTKLETRTLTARTSRWPGPTAPGSTPRWLPAARRALLGRRGGASPGRAAGHQPGDEPDRERTPPSPS
ncbi:MAG: TonB-dependent receptor [Gemmatimonadetes bacterium]|nr:TonB-dependent receptor [Gemmatimonadota bacterium]